jgi:hypothetical protein
MTKQAILEIIKIKKSISIGVGLDNQKNSLIILERNSFDKNFKIYMLTRISEYFRLKKEAGLINSFSELIFLEILDHHQHFSNFNILLQQTIELLVSFNGLFKMNNFIQKLFKISNWNLVNPQIFLKFRSIFNSFEEAKGFRNTEESRGKKLSSETNDNREFMVNKLENIRIFLDNEDYLISGILINNFFRINQWNLLNLMEKKIVSEQVIRILKKTQNFFLLTKFYYINAEYIFWNIENIEYTKICVFLSSIYFRLSVRSISISNFEKLLKSKISSLFALDVSNFLVGKNVLFSSFVNRLKILTGLFQKFSLFLNKEGINKMRRSFKRKLTCENLDNMTELYKTILISKVKNRLKIDSRDLEYYFLFNFEEKNFFIGIDNYRGILYLNFI